MAKRNGDVNQGGIVAPPATSAVSAGLSSDEQAQLLAAAQLEIEAGQKRREADRDLILELQQALEAAKQHRSDVIGDALLSRDVAADEHDGDPQESPGSTAYDAGLRAGLLRAAIICETRWAGEVGSLAAASIREAEEAIQ